ncbi:MAG: HNH endonuclease [Armatimonadaceae bacterium]
MPQFGELPGYADGHWFPDRQTLHDAGVHRPLQAGICGTARLGAESIVLSGGYEDDEDHGEIILYTGEGGNDPRTKKQVYDQTLTRGNMALARNVVQGIPVRVVRGAKHRSPYSPPAGYTYAGVYRVEGFWSEIGKSGFRIWRFRLRKMESEPAPRPFQVHEEKERYVAAPRVHMMISRLIRQTEVANAVKEMHQHTCQICGTRIETPGGAYAEAAHIQPLGIPHNGPDTADNILCLCPNCHVQFVYGALTIEDDLTISGHNAKLRTVPGHQINIQFLRYHRLLFKTAR